MYVPYSNIFNTSILSAQNNYYLKQCHYNETKNKKQCNNCKYKDIEYCDACKKCKF